MFPPPLSGVGRAETQNRGYHRIFRRFLVFIISQTGTYIKFLGTFALDAKTAIGLYSKNKTGHCLKGFGRMVHGLVSE
jgi:hypothetical protein